MPQLPTHEPFETRPDRGAAHACRDGIRSLRRVVEASGPHRRTSLNRHCTWYAVAKAVRNSLPL